MRRACLPRFPIFAMFALLLLAAAPLARAQCDPQWLPGVGHAGVNDTVNALLEWDPDGPGSDSPVLVVGGIFTMAGNVPVSRVASWDGMRWSAMGGGVNGAVTSLAVHPNGDLLVGGSFTTAGGVSARGVARWDGQTWHSLGTGVASVRCMTVLPDGRVVVAGTFSTAGGVSVNNLAVWDGEEWAPLGEGINESVTAVGLHPSGDLLAVGDRRLIDTLTSYQVFRWDGTAWLPVGGRLGATGLVQVATLLALPDGELIVGGLFNRAGDVVVHNVARWNGEAWSPMGSQLTQVRKLYRMSDGTLYASGHHTARLSRWNGSEWEPFSSIGTSAIIVDMLERRSGELVVGGVISLINDVSARNVAVWAGGEWGPLQPSLSGTPTSLRIASNGDLFVVTVLAAHGVPIGTTVARFDGVRWSRVGALRYVNDVEIMPNGDLIAAAPVLRWTGHEWTTYVPDQSADHLLACANGDLLLARQTRVFRWNGQQLVPLGGEFAGPNATVRTLLELPNGDILVGGTFQSVGGVPANGIARWNGSAWSALGVGTTGSVLALAVLPNGDIVMGGTFAFIGADRVNYIARWDGLQWRSLGGGVTNADGLTVNAIAILPDGSLVAGGRFTRAGGTPVSHIARWDGAAWSPLGSGTNDWIRLLQVTPEGDLHVGGMFTTAGGNTAHHWARWVNEPRPRFTAEPPPVTIESEEDAVLAAVPLFGLAERAGGLTYAWFRNGEPISDGPGGASTGGGFVSGASGVITATIPITLTITAARASDAGEYTLVLGNSCGETASTPTTLTVTGTSPCPADWNNDGTVNSTDLSAFITSWLSSLQNGDLHADFNADGQVNSSDLSAFITAWLNAIQNGC